MNRFLLLIGLLVIGCGDAEAQKVRSFNLSVTSSGPGQVVSVPTGIDCPSICQAKFNSGTTITLEARPDPSATFSGWGGACSGTDTICFIDAIIANTSASANFGSSGGGGTQSGTGFEIVDSTGKTASTRILEDACVLIEYTVGGNVHFAVANLTKEGFSPSSGPCNYGTIFFTTSDCTGQAYFSLGDSFLDRRRALVVMDENNDPEILYSSLDASPTLRLIGSSRPYNEVQCVPKQGFSTELVFSAAGTISIKDWWAPPFYWR